MTTTPVDIYISNTFAYSYGRGPDVLPDVLLPRQAVWGVLLYLHPAAQQDMERNESHIGGLRKGWWSITFCKNIVWLEREIAQRIDLTTHRTKSERSYHGVTSRCPLDEWSLWDGNHFFVVFSDQRKSMKHEYYIIQ